MVEGFGGGDALVGIEREHAFELGGLRFELIATPGGETRESMVVWLPRHRICFAGNAFGADVKLPVLK